MIVGLIAALSARPTLVAGFVLAACAALVIGSVYLTGRDHGRDAVHGQITEHNEHVRDVMGAAHADSDACHDAGREWDVSTGTCR